MWSLLVASALASEPDLTLISDDLPDERHVIVPKVTTLDLDGVDVQATTEGPSFESVRERRRPQFPSLITPRADFDPELRLSTAHMR